VTRKYREWIAGRSMTVSCPRPSPEAYPVRGLLKYCGDCVWVDCGQSCSRLAPPTSGCNHSATQMGALGWEELGFVGAGCDALELPPPCSSPRRRGSPAGSLWRPWSREWWASTTKRSRAGASRWLRARRLRGQRSARRTRRGRPKAAGSGQPGPSACPASADPPAVPASPPLARAGRAWGASVAFRPSSRPSSASSSRTPGANGMPSARRCSSVR